MAKLRIDKVVPGNVVFHAHGGEDITILVDTKANILALTPTAGKMALSSDTYEFFVADGTNWRANSLPEGVVSVLTDIGAIPYKQDWGYGVKDLSDKKLYNIVVRDFVEGVSTLEKGAFRYNVSTGNLELYNGSSWLTVITLTAAQVRDWMLRTDWNAQSVAVAPTIDTVNKTVMTLGFVDIGAYPTDVILHGGTLL